MADWRSHRPPLSPAAQAVKTAVLAAGADATPWALQRPSTVAALRVAANQVMADPSPVESLLAIAAELGAHHG